MNFSIKFPLDVNMQNNPSWNISNFGLCGGSLALNMSQKSERVFWNTKIYWKNKFHRAWAELEMKIYFRIKPWTKYSRKKLKLNDIGFSIDYFTADFSQFCSKTVKICFLDWLSTFPSNPSLWRTSRKVCIILISQVLNRWRTCEATRVFIFWL